MRTATNPPRILPLDDIGPEQLDLVGVKAATLAALRGEGFPVPGGFVVTTAARAERASRPTGALAAEIVAAAEELGTTPLAVRSSAVAEDRADRSFAGQYETVLNVMGPGELLEAVARVWASAGSRRVRGYRTAMKVTPGGGSDNDPRDPTIAVLVQPMVPASAAGVAFTADPLTGDGSLAVVSAVRGVGERLVSGEVTPEEWEIRNGTATLRGQAAGSAIDADTAGAAAALARRVERRLGVPQDVEWAVADGTLVLLQARPMTALPEAVSWDPPEPGLWLRNFRFGEWLGEPVSPLFESWALTGMERRLDDIYASWIGIRPPAPSHVVVNGWYFYGFNPVPAGRLSLLRAVLLHILPSFLRRPRRASLLFPPLARFGVGLACREFRASVQPAYRERVRRAEVEIPSAEPGRLVQLVDELVDEAGTYFTSLTSVGGYAAKAELPLAGFYRRVLAPLVGGSFLDLLAGLGEAPPATAHGVATLDWISPPAGGGHDHDTTGTDRRARAAEVRTEAERRARRALSSEPKLRHRFDILLARAQRFGLLREEQAAEFPLAWPIMRRAVLRLGAELVSRGLLTGPEQVFYLRREEVVAALDGEPAGPPASLEDLVGRRHGLRARQRRLTPPLMLGTAPPLMRRMLDQAIATLRDPITDRTALVGIPASAGTAAGPVRVVRSSEDFAAVQPGDVLVAPMTTPAWSTLLSRVCAVVTDNGGIGAHASIVAREYGIPAVVGLGDATSRLMDGELVEVRGSEGYVRRL